MPRDRHALVIALAFALAACSEDPVPKLEAEKKALLESTRPKAEFWSEVERKGELFKQKKAIDAELADVQQKTAAIQPELQQLGAALAGAGEANARAEQVLAESRAELARIEGEVAAREATLAAFDQRRSERP
jgi:septal ring factor EnvC (AmiA/AmiB activator)